MQYNGTPHRNMDFVTEQAPSLQLSFTFMPLQQTTSIFNRTVFYFYVYFPFIDTISEQI
jgi:hypothetical protein